MYHRQPLPILILCLLLLGACKGGGQDASEDELSAFGAYVHQLDTAKLTAAMNSIVKGDTARWTADMTVRQRYTDIPQFEEKPVWFSRMGVSEDADSLLAFLRREAPRNGLDTLAFFVPQIAEDLAIVREGVTTKLVEQAILQRNNEVGIEIINGMIFVALGVHFGKYVVDAVF